MRFLKVGSRGSKGACNLCVYEEYYQTLACFFAFSSGYDDEENDNPYTYVDPPGMYTNRLN